MYIQSSLSDIIISKYFSCITLLGRSCCGVIGHKYTELLHRILIFQGPYLLLPIYLCEIYIANREVILRHLVLVVSLTQTITDLKKKLYLFLNHEFLDKNGRK